MCVVPISPVFADDLPLTDAERILDALIAVERGMGMRPASAVSSKTDGPPGSD